MRRNFRALPACCRGLGAAACALALALPLHAQSPPARQRVLRVVAGADGANQPLIVVPVADPPPQLDTPPPVPTPAPVPETGLTVETQVKLAWLSDPVTFPYALGAEMTPKGLAVSGFVPSAAVHSRVVQLAQQTCGAAVIDRLQIHPNLYLRLPGFTPAADLKARARELLTQEFPEQAAHVQVSADGRGRVRVAGAIGSAADQLAISQCLRRLDGCACVSNELQLPASAVATLPLPGEVTAAVAPQAAPEPMPVSATRPVSADDIPAVSLQRPVPIPDAPPGAANPVWVSKAAPPPTATWIRGMVEAMCGADARDVRIEEFTERRLIVSLRVAREDVAQRLGPHIIQRLEQVPDLANREVGLRVRLAE
jgi:hypothetical protein